MKVLLVEPHKVPQAVELDGSLASMQRIVGGTIQVLYPFQDAVALICNDNGKVLGLPFNRALFDEGTGQMYDIIAGAFFICTAPLDSDNFVSLTEEQLAKYAEKFQTPELFIRVNGTLLCLPDWDSAP